MGGKFEAREDGFEQWAGWDEGRKECKGQRCWDRGGGKEDKETRGVWKGEGEKRCVSQGGMVGTEIAFLSYARVDGPLLPLY